LKEKYIKLSDKVVSCCAVKVLFDVN